MNRLILLLLCVIGSAVYVAAQSEAQSPAVVSLGSRVVRLPAPSGFVEIAGLSDHLVARFKATDSSGNHILGTFVPASIVPGLKKGQIPPFDTWANVSVDKDARTNDLPPEGFKFMVEEFEKFSPQLLDENSSLWKTSAAKSNKGLSELYGKDMGVDISQPKSLGVFNRGANVFSSLIVTRATEDNVTRTVLASITILRVNERLLYVYAYQILRDETDIDRIRNFTKTWTAAILAANK